MISPEENVPVTQCVLAAWGFFTRNIGILYRFGLPYIFFAGLALGILQFTTPESPFAIFGLFFTTGSWFLFFAMEAAVYRLALGMDRQGIMGLNLGLDEARLFLVYFLIAVVSVIVAIVMVVLLSLIFGVILTIGMDPQVLQEDETRVFSEAGGKFWVLLMLGGAFVFLVLLYLRARFSPAYPAAIAEQNVQIFEAAAWTKGQGLRISLALIIVLLPIYLIMTPSLLVMGELMVKGIQAFLANPDAAPPAELGHIDFQWRLLPILLAPALSAIRAGLFCTLYRGLRPAN